MSYVKSRFEELWFSREIHNDMHSVDTDYTIKFQSQITRIPGNNIVVIGTIILANK